MEGLDDRLRADAARSLGDVLEWKLSADRWNLIGEILDIITEAEASSDPDAQLAGIAQLELAGPGRFTRIGATPTQPAPQQVRERITYLIYRLLPGRPVAQPAKGES